LVISRRRFLTNTLGLTKEHADRTTLRFVRPAPEHKLPVVLSRDEVRRVLAAVRIPVYRVLTLIGSAERCTARKTRTSIDSSRSR
jgi:integrase